MLGGGHFLPKLHVSASSPAHVVPIVYADSQCPVEVKKYTEDHEWIELDADGKTGTGLLLYFPGICLPHPQVPSA